jgi:hypothetical protein
MIEDFIPFLAESDRVAAISAIDRQCLRILSERRLMIEAIARLCDDGCPNSENAECSFVFDHAYAGVLVYLAETGSFLFEKRGGGTLWNPHRIAIPGRPVGYGEHSSGVAASELARRFGIEVRPIDLHPLRSYVETRIRVPIQDPVARNIYALILGRIPRRIGGAALDIVEMPAQQIDRFEELTFLSREDASIFLNFWYPQMAA